MQKKTHVLGASVYVVDMYQRYQTSINYNSLYELHTNERRSVAVPFQTRQQIALRYWKMFKICDSPLSPSRSQPGPSTAQAAAPEEPTYTTEQLEVVRRINECKDPYQILEVTKECTDSDVKQAYKKLALKVHPDKNKAPGAVEAFKSLGDAVAILTDAEKRMRYDMYGDESREQPRQAYQYDTDLKGFILIGLGIVGLAAAGIWLYKKSKESRKRDSDKEDSSVQPMEH